MHEVVLSKDAARTLEKLTPQMRRRIMAALVKASADPLRGKRLRGEMEGLFTLRIGDVRAVYELDSRKQVIVVHAIGPRGNIYKK
jgi:mRNA-degrading endonuclease RelE of RelBE toxin-antitoxin system